MNRDEEPGPQGARVLPLPVSATTAAAASRPPTTRAEFDALFRRYARHVAGVAFRLLGRRDEVEDLTQEVFLEALRQHDQLRNPSAIQAWLTTVTVRMARRRLRRRQLKRVLGLDRGADYEEVAGSDAGPEQRALVTRVYAALDRVPVDLRLAWVLRHIEGESLDEVARACGCSLATAKRRIAAAHEMIGKAVGDG